LRGSFFTIEHITALVNCDIVGQSVADLIFFFIQFVRLSYLDKMYIKV
jgi:hypothetical protein